MASSSEAAGRRVSEPAFFVAMDLASPVHSIDNDARLECFVFSSAPTDIEGLAIDFLVDRLVELWVGMLICLRGFGAILITETLRLVDVARYRLATTLPNHKSHPLLLEESQM